MASTLNQADLTGLLDVLDAGRTSTAPEGLPMPLLERLRMLVRCDSISFTELDMTRRECVFGQSSPDEDADTELPDEDVFWLHYDEDLHCSYPTRTGDDRTVTTVSDFYSIRETHNTPMYRDFTRYFGVEHELLLCFPPRTAGARGCSSPEDPDATSTPETGCCSRYCDRTYTSSTKSSSANDARYQT